MKIPARSPVLASLRKTMEILCKSPNPEIPGRMSISSGYSVTDILPLSNLRYFEQSEPSKRRIVARTINSSAQNCRRVEEKNVHSETERDGDAV